MIGARWFSTRVGAPLSVRYVTVDIAGWTLTPSRSVLTQAKIRAKEHNV